MTGSYLTTAAHARLETIVHSPAALLTTHPFPPLGPYAIYLEEMLAVLVIILLYARSRGQAGEPIRLVAPRKALAAALRVLTHWIVVLEADRGEGGRRASLVGAERPAPLRPSQPPLLCAGSTATLEELVEALAAQGGFIALKQDGSFAVVASVNSLPVGHRLELAEAATERPHMLRLGASAAAPGPGYELDGGEPAQPEAGFERAVEQALKGLSDTTLLGRSELVVWLGLRPAAQIEQAKRLRHKLLEAIDCLRPAGAPPSGPVPRDWHAYWILHEAYVEDVPNRDIMSRLYISEGTFNRQRRKAVRAVATILWEARLPATAPESEKGLTAKTQSREGINGGLRLA